MQGKLMHSLSFASARHRTITRASLVPVLSNDLSEANNFVVLRSCIPFRDRSTLRARTPAPFLRIGSNGTLPLGAKAVKDLDLYLRIRARHKHEHLPWLWLSSKGQLTSSGIAQMIKRRFKAAGIPAIHPHQFRHTFSHLWLGRGRERARLGKAERLVFSSNGWAIRILSCW